MKSFTALSTALLAAGASAQQAIVRNNCQSTVYVQSFPYDGSAAGPLTTLTPGQTFSESFRQVGSVRLSPPHRHEKKAELTRYADRKDCEDKDFGWPTVLRLLVQLEPGLCLL